MFVWNTTMKRPSKTTIGSSRLCWVVRGHTWPWKCKAMILSFWLSAQFGAKNIIASLRTFELCSRSKRRIKTLFIFQSGKKKLLVIDWSTTLSSKNKVDIFFVHVKSIPSNWKRKKEAALGSPFPVEFHFD